MTDDYTLQERIAIKQDSHIPEKEAILQAKKELETPECIARINRLHERDKMSKAQEKVKLSRKYNYAD